MLNLVPELRVNHEFEHLTLDTRSEMPFDVRLTRYTFLGWVKKLILEIHLTLIDLGLDLQRM